MTQLAISSDLAARLVRYRDLKPCTTAFIDTRSPGSSQKENFTIIGPGVAENPDQYVHIPEPHGFNIGGARQPPRCVNSQHYHETVEVFLVHSGRWAFRSGEHADEGEVVLGPGDVISIPTRIFRGFENIGEGTGFLYAVLGGDDAGHVVWAPDVLERAKSHGLILTESGRLIDTLRGETLRPGEAPMRPPSRDQLETVVRHADSSAMARIIVPHRAATGLVEAMIRPGVKERVIIGQANPPEGAPDGPLNWPHGFSCRRLEMEAGALAPDHVREGVEVLFVQRGAAQILVDGEAIDLGLGDTFSVPPGAARRFVAGPEGAELFVTRGGDQPAPPRFL